MRLLRAKALAMTRVSPFTNRLPLEKGFTLLEVMFAAFILVTALIGLFAVIVNSANLIESSRDMTTALHHASTIIEEMRTKTLLTNITSQDWNAWPGVTKTLNNEVITVTYIGADPLEIKVKITWTTARGYPGETFLQTTATDK